MLNRIKKIIQRDIDHFHLWVHHDLPHLSLVILARAAMVIGVATFLVVFTAVFIYERFIA